MENPERRNEKSGTGQLGRLVRSRKQWERLTEIGEKARRYKDDLHLLRSEEEDLGVDFSELRHLLVERQSLRSQHPLRSRDPLPLSQEDSRKGRLPSELREKLRDPSRRSASESSDSLSGVVVLNETGSDCSSWSFSWTERLFGSKMELMTDLSFDLQRKRGSRRRRKSATTLQQERGGMNKKRTAEMTSGESSRSEFPDLASSMACRSSTEDMVLSVAEAPTRKERDCREARAPLMLI